MATTGNLFADIAPKGADEQLTELLRAPGMRIERIVSHGHNSPPGFWYDQDRAEWVLLVEGAAVLAFEDDPEPIRLEPGDHVLIRRTHAIASNGAIRTGRRSGSRCIMGDR